MWLTTHRRRRSGLDLRRYDRVEPRRPEPVPPHDGYVGLRRPTSAAALPAADADHLTVSITAKRPCWVSATVDGQKAIERLLQSGEQKTLEVKREMVLTAGDAAAI